MSFLINLFSSEPQILGDIGQNLFPFSQDVSDWSAFVKIIPNSLYANTDGSYLPN